MSESRFDFLRELVKNIPDINVAEEQQCDNYPDRRESSDDGTLSIDSPGHNGSTSNPNGSSRELNTAGGSTSHWKYTKQHSMDSITTNNDNNSPINYSIKIKVDDKPTPAKLLRMESTPASFGSNNNIASPIIKPNYLPIATPTNKLSEKNDKPQPILHFDFTKIPLLPSAASTSQTATSSNHSHSVSNILKLNEKSAPSTTDTTKNEVKTQKKKKYIKNP